MKLGIEDADAQEQGEKRQESPQHSATQSCALAKNQKQAQRRQKMAPMQRSTDRCRTTKLPPPITA